MPMLGYYRNALSRVASLLHKLKASPEDLATLWGLQVELIHLIKRGERGILRARTRRIGLKGELRRGGVSRERAAKIKAGIARCERRAADYRFAIYLFKCFGDGIAFIYLDRFSLKHTYYKTTDYTVREEPGFVTSNRGFRRERLIARNLIRGGFPAVLTDITNVVRFGDICGLVASDPILIEVKSSKNRNARTTRQQNNLEELGRFFVHDGAEEFRGTKNVVRQSLHATEVTHEIFVNELVGRAFDQGWACGSPEPGLLYIAVTKSRDLGADARTALEAFCVRPVISFYLNEAKNTKAWLPLYPFTLSLSEASVVPFVLGEVLITVLIDVSILKGYFQRYGASMTLLPDDCDYAIQVVCRAKEPSAGIFRVSRQMFARIALEFWSLDWFAKEQVTVPNRLECPKGNEGFDVPTGWLDIDDGIEALLPHLAAV